MYSLNKQASTVVDSSRRILSKKLSLSKKKHLQISADKSGKPRGHVPRVERMKISRVSTRHAGDAPEVSTKHPVHTLVMIE